MPNLPIRTAVAAALVSVLTSVPTATRAVEVRQPESQWQLVDRVVNYESILARAYAPCTAPNAMMAGVPACAPAVTSPCNLFFGGKVTIYKEVETNRIKASVPIGPGGPPECATGTYYLDLATRTSADLASACPSGHCTYQDTLLHLPMDVDHEVDDQKLNVLTPFETTEQDVQILGYTIVDPDGLPLAAASMLLDPTVFTSNLTVPYPACADPGPNPACDAAPRESACDFDVGATVNLTLPGVPSGTFEAQQHRTCHRTGSKLDCR